MVFRIVIFAVVIIVNMAKFCSPNRSTLKIPDVDRFRYENNRLLNHFKKDYIYKYLVISLVSPDNTAKNDSAPKYKAFQTGDNPYHYLEHFDPSPNGKPFHMTFKNQSKFEVVMLVNSGLGSTYIYISPGDSYRMGCFSDSCIIAVLAGTKWVANRHLPRISGVSEESNDVSYAFSGNFKNKAANYLTLLGLKKYALSTGEADQITLTGPGNDVHIESTRPPRKVSVRELADKE
jgi:hypothetical protein